MIPKISVILLTCNRTSFVRKALEGVLQQAYPDWTLRASDCSSDPAAREELAAILEEHRRKDTAHETRLIQQPEKVPQGEHLRRVLEGVTTPYVALLDDDDIWMPEHLQRALAWLEESPRHGLAISNGRVIDVDGTVGMWTNSREDPLPNATDQRGWLRLFMSSFFGSSSGYVFRSEAIANHSFLATSMVDIHLALSVLLNDYQITGFPEASYYYRVHQGSSYQKGRQVLRDRNNLRIELFRDQGLRIMSKFPLFPALVLKSAISKAMDSF
jgi:cellulose synthase/poly-beta-1,6-N-acetylglucosamine synthase-like glycosyltransferase